MVDIRCHPSTLVEEDGELLQTSLDFFIKIGFVPPSSQFVADESQSPVLLDEDENGDESEAIELMGVVDSVCKTACKTSRDIARAACQLSLSSSHRKKCRKRVEAAYQSCRAICDLA